MFCVPVPKHENMLVGKRKLSVLDDLKGQAVGKYAGNFSLSQVVIHMKL